MANMYPPLFLKKSMVPNLTGHDIYQALVNENDIEASQVDGVQPVGGVWRLYFNSTETRVHMNSNGININSLHYDLYSENPFSTGIHDPQKKAIKITVKDVPLSYDNDSIKRMIEGYGVKLTSPIKYGYYRNSDNKLTDCKNGDRFAFAEEIAKPLPRFATAGLFECRIFHQGQPIKNYCRKCYSSEHLTYQCKRPLCFVCRKPGHDCINRMEDYCEGYCDLKDNEDVVTVQGETDRLSMFYKCDLQMYGRNFTSGEAAYQYMIASRAGQTELVEEIARSPDGREAKRLSKFICSRDSEEQKQNIMKEVLVQKAKQCSEFKTELLNTENMLLAHSVKGDRVWGTGLSTGGTIRCHRNYWPGKNVYGCLLMELRDELIEEQTKVPVKHQQQNDRNKSKSKRPLSEESQKVNTPETSRPRRQPYRHQNNRQQDNSQQKITQYSTTIPGDDGENKFTNLNLDNETKDKT